MIKKVDATTEYLITTTRDLTSHQVELQQQKESNRNLKIGLHVRSKKNQELDPYTSRERLYAP